jgi:hypothetical protein
MSVPELWFTAPSHQQADALLGLLQAAGFVAPEEPYNAFADRVSRPARPWTVVVFGPCDEALLDEIAAASDCRFHPGGGASRWE